MLRRAILALFTFLLVLPLTGCPPPAEEKIKIGAVMDLTGALAGVGALIRDGALLAVKEINAAGGIDGVEVELIVEDGATDPAVALEAVRKLVEVDGVEVIIGPMTSGAVMAVGPYVGKREVVIVSPSATSPKIADQWWRPFVFRTCPSDAFQGAAMAQLVLDGGYSRVAILVMNNVYGVGIEKVVTEKLAGKVDIVAAIRYDPIKLDYYTELEIIRGKNPDAIIHVGYHDDGQIVYKQALEMGLDTIQWIAAEGVYGLAIFEMAEAAEFMERAVIGTRPIAPEGLAAYEEFAAAYEARFGVAPGVYADTAYDATKMVLQAIKQVGYDAVKIKEALREIGTNYPGVSGTITFDERGDRVGGQFEVWKVVRVDEEYKFERVKIISL